MNNNYLNAKKLQERGMSNFTINTKAYTNDRGQISRVKNDRDQKCTSSPFTNMVGTSITQTGRFRKMSQT